MNNENTGTKLEACINRERLVDTARRLIEVPSPTGQAGAALDCLADILLADGFSVERHEAGHPAAPAVIARLHGSRPGRTLQFDGHLDTVHLPFAPPCVADGQITGSGASDMKGGMAAAVEAFRALRDAGQPTAGGVMLVAHDLHEAPWGLGQQLNELIAAGLHGDAVLIPEPLCDVLPVAGRGSATWKVTFRRAGAPVHEVMRPADEPDVIAAGARFIDTLAAFSGQLAARRHPLAGCESVFVGKVHSGEIYNQYPQECWLEGTRRWLADNDERAVEQEFRLLVTQVATASRTMADVEWRSVRGAFVLDEHESLVRTFQTCYARQSGQPLPIGAKPFVDDGNSFWALARVPAITHGPRAGGQHTTSEWVSIDDLVRVAKLYAQIVMSYCAQQSA